MSSFDWAERVQRERAFDATEIGKAFRRFENLHARAWQTDTAEHVSDKRLKDVWAASNSAREELLKLLIPLSGAK